MTTNNKEYITDDFVLATEELKDILFNEERKIKSYLILLIDDNDEYIVDSNSKDHRDLALAMHLLNVDMAHQLIMAAGSTTKQRKDKEEDEDI